MVLVGGDEGCRTAGGEVPSLEARRRRPATVHRTGRRGLATDAQTPSEASSWASRACTRHTRIRYETGGNPVAILNRLLNMLQESGIPGPQLFRLKEEFSHALGQGGQGNVRGLDNEVARRYRQADKRIHKIWPAELIAIKQHIERKDGQAGKARSDNENLSSRFRAAECEVLALSPGLFRDHPNIVKLVGWGLCLDTIEDPASPCCGGLQLPLLVFERADMDLAEFLESLFPEPMRSDDARAEEGSAGLFRTRSPEPQRSWWSSQLHLCWTSLQRWSGLEPDPYEIVRLLCIDIGHGLQTLHENHFTHGDLKPENVLVFDTGRKWTAKLCDFGCAVGQAKTTEEDDAAVRIPQKEEYFGTPYWSPADSELRALRSFDSLRQCDLYVYGLLVWSSFCLRGKHPPAHPRLQDALKDRARLAETMKYPWLPLSPYKQWLVAQVDRLLKETMVDPAQRNLAPWTCLYRDSEHDAQHAESDDSDSMHAIDNTSPYHPPSDTNTPWPHTTLEMKARYNEYSWWRNDSGGHDWPDVTESVFFDPQASMATVSRGSPDDNGSGPASSVTFSSDDNCLSTALFVTPRRQIDARNLFPRMVWLLNGKQSSLGRQHWYKDLYHLARFRSRVRPEWWTTTNVTQGGNILMMALGVSPPVDISTLAWLCAGPIGSAEVKALDGEFATWESIVAPGALDESSRLDRFLLLLQFGADVEKKVRRRGQLRDLHIRIGWDSGTVFSQYMRSCRSATIPTVMREIAHRLDSARREHRISESTFKYFVGSRKIDGVPETAESDLTKDRNYTAIKALRQCITENSAFFRLGGHSVAAERDPMLPRHPTVSTALPHGWKVIGNRRAGDVSTCFEDEFTRSVTLTPPKVSPIKMRQVTVGFLQHSPGLSCHVDLLSCMRAGTGQDKRRKFEQDLKSRFPYYNDAWFTAEWNTEPNTDDVLKALKEPWRIQTFTTFLRTPGLMDKILAFFRVAGAVLTGGTLALAMAAILAGIAYAMWITFGWVAVWMAVSLAAVLVYFTVEMS
ncbi:hypothetical protein DL768_007122 [Monosporascus sp. mg162]|nr:hypothetical protein DL768_007122 [Monosporascus sp. mg162]